MPAAGALGRGSRMHAMAWCTLAVAVCCYLNTLPATFTFDDNFAVVSPLRARRSLPPQTSQPGVAGTDSLPLPSAEQINNGDVTDLSKPLTALLRTDFWWAARCQRWPQRSSCFSLSSKKHTLRCCARSSTQAPCRAGAAAPGLRPLGC